MNIFKQFTARTLKENRTRTIVTIIGIILSVAMFTATMEAFVTVQSYLVNYADDAGFALLSADSRLRPIYAISDEGSMSFSDTTYNKGLALFARGVEAEIRGIVVPPPR